MKSLISIILVLTALTAAAGSSSAGVLQPPLQKVPFAIVLLEGDDATLQQFSQFESRCDASQTDFYNATPSQMKVEPAGVASIIVVSDDGRQERGFLIGAGVEDTIRFLLGLVGGSSACQ